MILENKIALVTGGSRGIGRAICQRLAAMGATVGINYVANPTAAEETLQLIEAAGGKGFLQRFDVADGNAAQEAIKELLSTHGQLDILVNNAGITRDNLSMRMKDEEWNAVIQTNLTAVFRLSRGVLRAMMKARWGRIINITSVVGLSGNPGQMNYAAAKAGVAGMSRALAREVASRGITVNCVAPGFIDTDMTKALSEEQIKGLTSQIPAQRLGTPQDIAASVVFLASDGAGYITGVTLSVNGGMVMS